MQGSNSRFQFPDSEIACNSRSSLIRIFASAASWVDKICGRPIVKLYAGM
ncbi:hypothetical protein [Paenibacillus glycinis]|uniref:Uncharacterized protein n=1 Tax=Paenibacillus glycinis TaxID=2697035 RepID=A0ABW9XVB9_9BACL|nr:hypothetical protein [Paenibacillus glycinis]NBD26623.1 hypothetical protein [Paenibacillus glycinis]